MVAKPDEYGIVPRYFTWRGMLRENDEIRLRMSPLASPPVARPPVLLPEAPLAAGADSATQQGARWFLHLLEDAMEMTVAAGVGLVSNCSALVGSLLPWCAVAVCCHALIARLAGRALGDILR